MTNWNTTSTVKDHHKDNLIGKVLLGRYRIVKRLATGGMGVVYLARIEGAAGFVKPVVVKIILPSLSCDRSFLYMFIREATILSNLHHPGIATIIDFGKELDFYIMVLEYVHGFQLRDWITYRKHLKKALPAEIVIQIIINVLETLDYIHTLKDSKDKLLGLVHRDISPSNILIDTNGNVKIVDFGIARANVWNDDYRTRTGVFKGKLSYSAPERFCNCPATMKSDIYSVGVVLHEILVGKNEFYTKHHLGIINRVTSHTVSSVEKKRSDVPAGLDQVIQKSLQKNPLERYQTAMEFALDLRKLVLKDEQIIQNKMAAIIETDFTSEMAAHVKTDSLREREHAWQANSNFAFSPSNTESLSISLNSQLIETRVDNPRLNMRHSKKEIPKNELPITPSKNKIINTIKHIIRSKKNILVVGSILVGGICLYMAHQVETTPKASLVYIPKNLAWKTLKTRKERSATSNTAATSLSSSPTQNQLSDLTSAFKRNAGEIQDCFSEHFDELGNNRRISIRFNITANGKVLNTQIKPRPISNTELSNCIDKIARHISFPSQPRDLAFSIPITISR